MSLLPQSQDALALKSDLPAGWLAGYREWLQRSRDYWEAEAPNAESTGLYEAALREKQIAGADESLFGGHEAVWRRSEALAAALTFAAERGAGADLVNRARSEIAKGEASTLESWLLEYSHTASAQTAAAAAAANLAGLLGLGRLEYEVVYARFEEAVPSFPIER